MKATHLAPTKVGTYFLVHDSNDPAEPWSFWQVGEDDAEYMIVSWEGEVRDPPEGHTGGWASRDHRMFYTVPPKYVDGVIMLAQHTNFAQWVSAIERLAYGQDS